MKSKRKLKQLAWREYLPMAATIAMWAAIVLVIGHADAARLLAAATAIRGLWLLTKLSTPTALKRRLDAPSDIRHQARRKAQALQAACATVALGLVVLLVTAMHAAGQELIAEILPWVALGLPARYLRFSDVRTASPYYRLTQASGGAVLALLGWLLGWNAALFGLVFGAREWLAYAVLRLWPRAPDRSKVQLETPLGFAEVARYSAILGRRLLTYRLSKAVLAVFGPFGSAAARTGRGLQWHRKLEPYLPHHLPGFIMFSASALAGTAYLVLSSDEPAAMVIAAGLFQIACASANVILMWRYLPAKGEELAPEDDDDE